MAGRNGMVDLVTAAARLKIAWHKAHRLVLQGKLAGERRDGHWYVSEDSVRRMARRVARSRRQLVRV